MSKLWLVLAIPLVLGCVSEGGDMEDTVVGQCFPEITSGLEIINFYPDLYEVYSEESGITLTMEVENIGSSEATKIEAELFNLGGFDPDKTIARLSDMEVPEDDMPPVTDEADWSLTAPSFGTAASKEVSIGGSLYYDYISRGQASAVFIPSGEWRKMREEGDTWVDVEQDCSNGPVVVSVEPLRQPVSDKNGVATTEFTTRFVIANIGGGKVKSEEHGLDYIDNLIVTLPEYLEVGSVCDLEKTDDYDADTKRTLTNKDPIKLTQGMDKTLSCKLRLTSEAPLVRQATHKIEAAADYRYMLERTAALYVTEEAHSLTIKVEDDGATGDTKTWSKGSTYTIEVDPRYDGAALDTAETEDGWTATIKNDDTVALAVTCTVSDSGELVKLVCTCPSGVDNRYLSKDITLTAKLAHEGKHATARVEEITLS